MRIQDWKGAGILRGMCHGESMANLVPSTYSNSPVQFSQGLVESLQTSSEVLILNSYLFINTPANIPSRRTPAAPKPSNSTSKSVSPQNSTDYDNARPKPLPTSSNASQTPHHHQHHPRPPHQPHPRIITTSSLPNRPYHSIPR